VLLSGLGVLLLLAGFLLDRQLRGDLLLDYDRDLLARARTLAAGLMLDVEPAERANLYRLGAAALSEVESGRRGPASEELLRRARESFRLHYGLDLGRVPEFQPGPGAAFLEIHAEGLEVRSPSLAATGGPLPAPAGDVAYEDLTLPDGRRGRAVTLAVRRARFAAGHWERAWQRIAGEAPAGPGAVLRLARGRDELDALIGRVRAGFLAATLGLLGLASLLVWFAVRRGLAPLEGLRREVEALDPRALRTTLDVSGLPSEVQPVAAALEAALGRVEEALARERRTTAHIAHELRTPLAELRSAVDVAARWPDDAQTLSHLASQAAAICTHMERVVEAILRLARSSGAGRAVAPLDLNALVDSVAGMQAARAESRGLSIERRGPRAPVPARGDEEALHTVLSCLVENAVDHAPEGTAVDVEVRPGERPRVTVENQAPDLEPADLARFGEPFWRKDPARAGGEHVGLGLPLALALAPGAGFDLDFALTEGRLAARLTARAATPVG
jgi:two-component system sensor histidine kinase QseC